MVMRHKSKASPGSSGSKRLPGGGPGSVLGWEES